MFGREPVFHGYDHGGEVADDRRSPAGIVGGSAHGEAPAVEVDDDGVALAVTDLAGVVGGDVESQLEKCGVGAIVEGGGGEVAEEGGCGG